MTPETRRELPSRAEPAALPYVSVYSFKRDLPIRGVDLRIRLSSDQTAVSSVDCIFRSQDDTIPACGISMYPDGQTTRPDPNPQLAAALGLSGVQAGMDAPLPFMPVLYMNVRDLCQTTAARITEQRWSARSVDDRERIVTVMTDAWHRNPATAWEVLTKPAATLITKCSHIPVLPTFFPTVRPLLATTLSPDAVMRFYDSSQQMQSMFGRHTVNRAINTILSRTGEPLSVRTLMGGMLDTTHGIVLTPVAPDRPRHIPFDQIMALIPALASLTDTPPAAASMAQYAELAILTRAADFRAVSGKTNGDRYAVMTGLFSEWAARETEAEAAARPVINPTYWMDRRTDIYTAMLGAEYRRLDLNPDAAPRLTDPEFGLTRDATREQLLRKFFRTAGYPASREVMTRESLYENPAGYTRYIRKLTMWTANKLGIDPVVTRFTPIQLPDSIDLDDPVERARMLDFRRQEQKLKSHSDWLHLMLNRAVYREVVERLPYVFVPPYLDTATGPCPIPHTLTLRKTIDLPRMIVNDLPQLNGVDTGRKPQDERNWHTSLMLTKVGTIIKGFLSASYGIYIDHATARRSVAADQTKFRLHPEQFLIDYACHGNPVDSDVDMLLFGDKRTFETTAKKAMERVTQYEYYPSYITPMMGLSMSARIKYVAAIMCTRHGTGIEPWMAGNEGLGFMQALLAWPGRKTDETTKVPVRVLTGMSVLRSVGILPELMIPNKQEFFPWTDVRMTATEGYAAKVMDMLGMRMDYAAAGGGIDIAGIRRSVIRFLSWEDAFPIGDMPSDRTGLAAWHALRTVCDTLRYDGAVLFPEGLPENDTPDMRADPDRSWRLGASQFRHVVVRIADQIPGLPALMRTYDAKQVEPIRRDFAHEFFHGAWDAADADPYHFLVMCSGADTESPDRGLAGVELSRFYPNLHALRQDPDVWNRLLDRVREGLAHPGGPLSRREEEHGMEYISRLIFMDRDAIDLVNRTFDSQLLQDPLYYGMRMVWERNEERFPYRTYSKYGEDMHYGWYTLARDSYHYARSYPCWNHFVSHLKNNPLPRRARSWQELVSFRKSGTTNLFLSEKYVRPEEPLDYATAGPITDWQEVRRDRALAMWLTDIHDFLYPSGITRYAGPET